MKSEIRYKRGKRVWDPALSWVNSVSRNPMLWSPPKNPRTWTNQNEKEQEIRNSSLFRDLYHEFNQNRSKIRNSEVAKAYNSADKTIYKRRGELES